MRKKFWWPTALPEQVAVAQNFMDKIATYETDLGMTPAEVTAAVGLCTAFIGAQNLTESCKASMQAMTQWRDIVFYGDPRGTPVPAAPVFPVVGAVSYTRGVVTQLFALRDRIVNSEGYTTAIGEDLGLIGAEILPRPPAEVTPEMKMSVSDGNWVNLNGSMQGMDALRVEYARAGGQFSTVAFLTKTPAGFQITSAVPFEPEKGVIRTVFIKNNVKYGNYSPNYPVTIS